MTPEQVKALPNLFGYDADTGDLYRKQKHGMVKQRKSISSNGYARVGVFSKRIHAHRLIWALVYGQWPAGMDIDHINGNRADNRLANLRMVDRSTNLENIREAKSNNKSTGILGAYKHATGRFTSRIQVKGQSIYLGLFDTANQAHAAYMTAKRRYHKGATA